MSIANENTVMVLPPTPRPTSPEKIMDERAFKLQFKMFWRPTLSTFCSAISVNGLPLELYREERVGREHPEHSDKCLIGLDMNNSILSPTSLFMDETTGA